jgi:hypothetical protein
MDSQAFLRRFDTELHREWRRDRARRQRVPMACIWRGALAIALRLAAKPACHGSRLLLDNESLVWMVMREAPPGHFPGVTRLDCRESIWVSHAKAALRFGMPSLRFDGPAFDARAMPLPARMFGAQAADGAAFSGDVLHDADEQTFALVNWLNATLTDAAFAGVDAYGVPIRRNWQRFRPAGMETFTVPPPSAWMPRPLLGVPARMVVKLHNQPFCTTWRWLFCRALAEGMPLRPPADAVYGGVVSERRGRRVRLLHTLLLGGGERLVYALPRGAVITAGFGQALRAGEAWCKVCPRVPDAWKRLSEAERWPAAAEICGGGEAFIQAHRLWLGGQAVRLEGCPDTAFFDADLVDHIAAYLGVHHLVWDLSRCERYLDNELQAAILPPLRLGRWDVLRLAVGPIDIDATIHDPRLHVRPAVGSSAQRRRSAERHEDGNSPIACVGAVGSLGVAV